MEVRERAQTSTTPAVPPAASSGLSGSCNQHKYCKMHLWQKCTWVQFQVGAAAQGRDTESGAMVTESLWAPFTSFIQLCGQLHWLLGHERLTADRSVACPWVSAHFDLLCFYHRAVHSLTTVTRVLLGLLSWRMNSFLCFHWIFYDSCEIKSSKNVKSVF